MLIFTLFSITAFSQTYYYKQTAKISDGKRFKGNNTGQFITFTQKTCYDSDRTGISVNNGSLAYQSLENGILYYIGNSYWGAKTQYLFSEDKNRLNILPDNGGKTIYIYEKTIEPQGIKACYYIKNNNNGGTYYSSSPIENSGKSYSSPKSTTTTKTTKTMTCPYCKGSGKVEVNKSISSYGQSSSYSLCNVCGRKIYSGDVHYHTSCTQCHGSGILKL
ncbi:MAG: hypothetical protein ACK5MK_00740 [Dysgonomonas sp.]